MSNSIQIPLGNYANDKAAGNVKIVKISGQPFYSKRGFDPNTGAPTPINVPLDRESIVKGIADMQSQIDAAKGVLADIDAAQEAVA